MPRREPGLAQLLGGDPLGHLLGWARTLPRPGNYYVGAGNVLDVLPREVLAFYEDRDLSPDEVWAHHRFVLVVCLQGPGTVIVDSTLVPLNPLEAVLVFPYQSHHYARFQNDRIRWLFVTFELDDEGPIAGLRDRCVRLGPDELGLLSMVVRCYEDYARGPRTRFGRAVQSRQSGAWTALLLARLLGSPAKAQVAWAPRTDEMARLQRVLRYIHRHVGRRIGVTELAAQAHLSPSHLRRMFARRMGATLGAYVRRARVNKATGLLHRSELTITQVGAACGFSSLFAFSRAFKLAMGQSPKAYRRRLLDAAGG